ncbi:SAM-dependent methyltransferase [Spongiactinospora sp. TRM90649]|uniref:SAM-dependent methyltransferase n=1 Tax=Spongiactinospora sp. TRM90649 TaxID=3031114 RepID=UPI0023F98797|nr:SAM-dependent methyltransferase [Spongiactinospora sp. TRM90649]MDF5752089.1 SAM-dependent methyltransferase [Spongiactinospora sp. TRM90649]
MADLSGTPPESEPTPKIDTTRPHSARIWNYWVGGKDHYPIDREVGEQVREVFPDIIEVARHSRAFLGRVVRHLTEDVGIRQFLDIGTGLPTHDNTHEVAQRIAPESRIVYVDNDPLVLVHARALLVSGPYGATDYVDADVRDTDRIIAEAARTLDLTRPVGLVLLGIMGNVADDGEAYAIVRRLVAALPPGSHVAVNDGSNVIDPAGAGAGERRRAEAGSPYRLRSPAAIGRFLDGLDLLEPGLVSVSRWRPEEGPFGPPPEVDAFCGVGRKPG